MRPQLDVSDGASPGTLKLEKGPKCYQTSSASNQKATRGRGHKNRHSGAVPSSPPLKNESIDVLGHANRACRKINSPYMLSRFMTIKTDEDPLRHEVQRAIRDGMIKLGEDMWKRKREEEGWEEMPTEPEGEGSVEVLLGTEKEFLSKATAAE